MRILLTANHRSTMGFDRVIRIPNLGLCSIAANVDRKFCEVKVLDLILAGRNPRNYFRKVLKEYQPDVVGLSCMVFQYPEALELAKIVKSFNKDTKVVMGGYYPTVNYDVILESDDMEFIDFLIRKEGEIAFNELVKALHNGKDLKNVPNLSYRDNGSVIHNPTHPLINLDEIRPPDRSARILTKGFHFGGYPADAIETSRGCVFGCNYCSIQEMYGKSFRKFKIERVLKDIIDAQKRGAKAIGIVDDNVTLGGKSYKELCDAIVDAHLNKMKFLVQAGIVGIKNTPGLAEAMAKSGVKFVFLGIENASNEALDFMHKGSQFNRSDTLEVVREFKKLGVIVMGGFIIGYPDDTEETIWANFEYAKMLDIDIPIFFILTPHPKTVVRNELIKQGLVTNLNDYSKYTGFEACIRTKYLSADRLREIREEIGFKYPINSGTIWRLTKNFPISYMVKLVFGQFVKNPREVLGYLRGFWRD